LCQPTGKALGQKGITPTCGIGIAVSNFVSFDFCRNSYLHICVTSLACEVFMYQEFFGFSTLPFASAPDPKIFYLNPVYQAALDTLRYGVLSNKGLMVVTGTVGTGKTALLRKLFDDLGSTVQPIWLVSGKLSFASILQTMLSEFDARPTNVDLPAMIDALHGVLLHRADQEMATCLIIEEAQKLNGETLEGLRQLCNLEADSQKLLQVILVGHPNLLKKLDEPEHRSLKQRVALHCRLFPLTRSEVDRYIEFQLAAVGYTGAKLFQPGAVAGVAQYSGGIPRVINTICDNALLSAYRASNRQISQAWIGEVAKEMGLMTQSQVSPTPALDSEDWVSRKEEPQGPRGENSRWHLPQEAVRTTTSAVAPPRRRAARMFSAAVLALIPLGGAGWALYVQEPIPLLNYLKLPLQAVNDKLAAVGVSERELVKSTPQPQPVVDDRAFAPPVSDNGKSDNAKQEAAVKTPDTPPPESTGPLWHALPEELPEEKVMVEQTRKTPTPVARVRATPNPAVQERLLEIEIHKAILNRAIDGVSVNLSNGVVYLEGQVASERQKALAERAALGVNGKVRVANRLRIQR
jgi:general secretion pathway protein A